MNEGQKKKLEYLKAQAKINERRQRLQKNVLLNECLEALSSYSIIQNENKIRIIYSIIKL